MILLKKKKKVAVYGTHYLTPKTNLTDVSYE